MTVTITDALPYDVEASLEWSPTVGKLAVRKVTCTASPGGEECHPPASPASPCATPSRSLFRPIVSAALVARAPRRVQRPRPIAVDTLIYLLAVAFQSPKPTATVALARGLSPASGPKRVLASPAEAGCYVTEPGKSAGA